MLFFLFDGCRHGNETQLLSGFKKSDNKVMAKNKHQNFIMYEERALASRRNVVRGVNTLDQVEYLHVVSKEAPRIADRARRHFPGSSYGNCIGPVTPENAETLWHLTVAQKKALYGVTGRIEVGGKTPGVADSTKAPRRCDGDLEPVCYHSLPKTLIEELTHCYEIKAWINITCCDGILEEHCIEEKLPCLSVCFTDKHIELLQDRLLKRTFSLFQEQESNLFQAGLVGLLGKKTTTKNQKAGDLDTSKKEPKGVQRRGPSGGGSSKAASSSSKAKGKAAAKHKAVPKTKAEQLKAKLKKMQADSGDAEEEDGADQSSKDDGDSSEDEMDSIDDDE